jgi:hypothetical protein
MAHLDDNTRSGLHFLGLGLLVVGVPVLIIALMDASQTAVVTTDAARLHIFRNGYLLPIDGPQLTLAHTTRGERMGIACLAAVLLGAVIASLAWLLQLRKWHWAIGRYAALITLAWSLYAAVLLPARTVAVRKDSLILTDRTTFLSDLPLPFSRREHEVRLPEVHGWSIRPAAHGTWTELLLTSSADTMVVASTRASEEDVHGVIELLNR